MSRNMWRSASVDGKTVTLRRPETTLPNINSLSKSEFISLGLVVDIETTGFNHTTDSIIELGIVEFAYNSQTAQIVGVGRELSYLHDPGIQIPETTKRLTGISNKDILNQKILWEEISQLFKSAQLIIAHNASFERNFLNRVFDTSGPTWACSMTQINWYEQGYYSKSLETLAIHNGFFGNFHRALEDSKLTLAVLLSTNNNSNSSNFAELLKNAHTQYSKVIFSELAYENRHIARDNGFKWNARNRTWEKIIHKHAEEDLLNLLSQKYRAEEYKLETLPINLKDNFLWDSFFS